jgi:putative resolvase
MKLSQYARTVGVTYRTAFRWWQNGQIKGYQTPSGTIVITEGEENHSPRPEHVVIYARVSSHKQTADLERQVQRLLDYCAAKGYQVARSVKEIGSGLNDNRPKFLALLTDQSITRLVIEHKDRATRFGFGYLEALLEMQGRCLEVVNLAEPNREDLLADLTSVIYSICAKLYGQRRAKIKAETILKQVEEP